MKRLIRVPIFFALLITGTSAFSGMVTSAGSYSACQAYCEEQGLSVQSFSPVGGAKKLSSGSGTEPECICGSSDTSD